MLAAEYQRLSEHEDQYWWYIAQREHLLEEVGRLPLPSGARVLDAGCGTGRNLLTLTRKGGYQGYGIDVSPHAAAHWNGQAGLSRMLASVNELPFADDSFDLVVSVDVLGCSGVQADRAMAEFRRVLSEGGYLVLLVPAYQWLRSRHDEAVHSVHRFGRQELAALAFRNGLKVIRLGHRFMTFFPAIAGVRLWRKRALSMRESAQSDLSPMPSWLNAGLLAIARLERRWLGRCELPFGTTLLMVARK